MGKQLINMSGGTSATYKMAFSQIQNVININTSSHSLNELGVKFGGVRLVAKSATVLADYKEKVLASMPTEQRAYAKFDNPALTAAAFFLTAKREQFKVNQHQLLILLGIQQSDFVTVCNSMTELCFRVRKSLNKDANKKCVNKKHPRCNNRDSRFQLQDPVVFMPVSDTSKRAKRNTTTDAFRTTNLVTSREYQEWRVVALSRRAAN